MGVVRRLLVAEQRREIYCEKSLVKNFTIWQFAADFGEFGVRG